MRLGSLKYNYYNYCFVVRSILPSALPSQLVLINLVFSLFYIRLGSFSIRTITTTSNSWHYRSPRSSYCRSIVFLLVVQLFEIYEFIISIMKIFTHIPYKRWDKYRKRKVPCTVPVRFFPALIKTFSVSRIVYFHISLSLFTFSSFCQKVSLRNWKNFWSINARAF